jgi:preprotein translocase SecE subunit
MDFVDNIVDYFKSSKAELEKVTWPSKQETIRYSTLVIGGSVALAVFFAVLDQALLVSVQAALSQRPRTASTQQQQLPVTPDLEPNTIEATTPSGEPAPVDLKTIPLDSAPKTVTP